MCVLVQAVAAVDAPDHRHATFIREFTRSSGPVISTVNEEAATSMTRARKMLASSVISERAPGGALTLISASSRITVGLSLTSATCLATCSTTRSSPLTTMVMREMPGSSLCPTLKLSML